jgi:hypothetical protein
MQPPIIGEARLDARRLRRAIYESSLMLRFRWLVHGALVLGVASQILSGRTNLAIGAVVIAFWIGLSTAGVHWNVRRILGELGANEGPVRYVFEAGQFTVSGPRSMTVTPYERVRSFHDGGHSFLLESEKTGAYVLKEAFAIDDLAQLRTLLREKVKAPARGRVSDVLHLAAVIGALLVGLWLLARRTGL